MIAEIPHANEAQKLSSLLNNYNLTFLSFSLIYNKLLRLINYIHSLIRRGAYF